MGIIRAHSVLSAATTYWAETAYTVEQFVAQAGSVGSGGTQCSEGTKLLANDTIDVLLGNVFDLDVEESDDEPSRVDSNDTDDATFPTTLEVETEWACFNLHRVEFHWLQMHKHDPQRSPMDVSFMKELWEGMKFPEKKLYSAEQVERLARSAMALAYFRQSMEPHLPRNDVKAITYDPLPVVSSIAKDISNLSASRIQDVPHRAPSTSQSVEAIHASLAAFKAFCNYATSSDEGHHDLARALEQLENSTCAWFPQYGCVILAIAAGYNALSHLVLLYPDMWQANVSHRSTGATFTAKPSGTTELDVGTIPTEAVEGFRDRLQALLHQVATRHGNARSAVNGQGHQKTPHFIHALARQVLSSIVVEVAPYGGSTDVGMHTGIQPRATAHPLVEAALYHFVAHPPSYDRLRGHFLLWVAKQYNVEMTVDSINTAMSLVDAIALAALDMDEHGANVKAITEQLQMLRATLDSQYLHFTRSKAERFKIVEPNDVRYPALVSDALRSSQVLTTPLTMQERQARALANSGALPNFPHYGNVSPGSFQQILTWISSDARLKAGKEQDACLLVLNEIHEMMWSCAKHLSATQSPMHLSVDDVSALDQLVTAYSELLDAWLTSNDGRHQMMAKLRSYEVVVTWMGYCLVHQHCAQEYPLVLAYQTPLNWMNLGSLVLEDKRAIDAMRLVAGYIRRINNAARLPLFSLASIGGTVEFSQKFAETCDEMQQRWSSEEEATSRRMETYMNQVRAKQVRAAKLRAELPGLQSALSVASTEYTQAQQAEETTRINYPDVYVSSHKRRHGYYKTSDQVCTAVHATSSALSRMNAAQRNWDAKNAEFSKTIVPPPFVVCPLPELADKAFSVLFFFLIPPSLDTLSRLAVEAQVSLVPQFEHGLAWSANLNPYLVTEAQMHAFFTDQLDDRQFQWIMEFPACASQGESSRGNLSYANLHDIPPGLSKAEFLTMGSLRAYPNQQMRKLVQALHASTLPLSHPLVLSVLCQTMYHVGALSDADLPALLWKRDLDDNMGWLEKWHAGLWNQLGLLRDSIRDYKAFIAGATMASYLSQFYPQARQLAREFVAVARNWATIIRNEMDDADTTATQRLDLRAKQCLMYGYGILALSVVGAFDTNDVSNLVECIVMFRYGLLFGEGNKMQTELSWLQVQVAHVMACRIHDVLATLQSTGEGGDDIISRAMGGVFPHLQVQPSRVDEIVSLATTVVGNGKVSKAMSCLLPTPAIQWTIISQTSCFESTVVVRGEPEHYLINVLTGCVLLNGNPPCRLPRSIVQHATYTRYFDEQDFDVMRVLELVELTESAWMSGLPIRLLKMHSHWLDCTQKLLVFRPPTFKSRVNQQYLAVLDDPSRCFEVPYASQHIELTEVIAMRQSYRYFVEESTVPWIATALSKFENVAYVHAMMTPGKILQVHLPRYGLTFEGHTVNPRSLEFTEFHLATTQQLDFTLPFFEHYLVLERLVECPGQPSTKLLVPNGMVVVRNGMVTVQQTDACDAALSYFTYDFAPHSNQLSANSIVGRLQLAAIFAASSSSVPDPHLNMTGSEMALILLRQCWVSRPWTELEASKLANLASFAYKEPALAILCERFAKQALDRAFLYVAVPAEPNHAPNELVNTSKCELRGWNTQTMPWNDLRRGLQPHEMIEAFGPIPRPRRHDSPPGSYSVSSIPPCPVSKDVVAIVERSVLSMVEYQSKTSSRPYPLKKQKLNNSIEAHVGSLLKKSWPHYQALPQPIFTQSKDNMEKVLQRTQRQVQGKVDTLESYLVDVVRNCIPTRHVHRMNLRRACNRVANPTLRDMLVWAHSPHEVLRFNPYFSPEAVKAIQGVTQLYLATVVLNARLCRILHLIESTASDAQVLQELQVTRTWSIEDHPRWLVFEVEGSLQIRPEQAAIAQHLLNEPSGTICQLNMGLGKTRVILPLLILHYTSQGHVPRVHILGPILQEALAFFHLHLSASTLAIRILDQPFHRQAELTSFGMSILGQPIMNACYVVAPEHRLSLEMKLQEWVYEKNVHTEPLAALLAQSKFVDIFDEVDALLHHRYQLVYAMGTPDRLDNCETRAVVAQGLLAVLNTCDRDSRLHQWIFQHGLQNTNKSKSAFREIRLKVGVPEAALEEFRRLVAHAMIAHSSVHFQWLGLWCQKSSAHKDALVRCLLLKDGEIDGLQCLASTSAYASMLALRGFLAFGILEHCLQQRPRVQYGVDPHRHPKRLAIPFRAADVPSARAEFGHPDVSIFLTTLAYYYQGLTETQVLEAVKVLLSLGRSARTNEYETWFSPIRDELQPKESQMLDNCSKLDTSNGPQMTLLVAKLAFSTNLIDFWLRRCVFPTDLVQYPARIAASAWDMAHSDHAKGFSGTNESNPILPTQITPNQPQLPSLLATNGLMLDRLMTCTVTCHALAAGTLWKSLMEYVVAGGYEALIDTGSLLAGISNEAISMYMLNHDNLHAKLGAIVYFDPPQGCWMSLNRVTRHAVPLHDSPIKERDSFVLFDEARSRGTDMKMRASAVAVLTLGPKLTKDKLMQGAGRLRLLGKHQRVVLAVPPEIQQTLPSVTLPGILEWVVKNTAANIEAGLPSWSEQGLFFCKSKQEAFQAVVEEHWALKDLYELPVRVQKLSSYVANQVETDYDGIDMAKLIADQCASLGAEVDMTLSYGEECERELQVEEEEQQEKDVEMREQKPRVEASWNYSSILTAKSAQDVQTTVVPLAEGMPQLWGLGDVAWPATIFGTTSFFITLASKTTLKYARVVDSVALFPNGDVLLLSDKEADAALELVWARSFRSVLGLLQGWLNPQFTLENVAMLHHAADGTPSPMAIDNEVALALLNGVTRFDATTQPSLKALLAKPLARVAISNLIDARGEGRNWIESDLEKACKLMELVDVANE
ncbi:hypothetical protein DYB34_006572 [Aphanomyces astaci]|uniref:ubiquitinyl hydrolase 1 n=1 Tax=Aphanomyces astaci TaxID=112090 RepID=A0A418BQJ8_APHAT|nr:hypothetical protein DYB34_006572 [Aphanomyces astaci]